ncbi:MAG: hypothetical protein HDT39_08055 [Lachnospiraceae bacterium]|nr:hypothetical protein [Lachnospiraceae bacterium]
MKYRYQVMINVVILALATCCIIYFIKIDNEKNNSSVYYLTSEEREEIDKEYEELIKFCEENQEEIGAISEEFLSIMEADMPYEEYIELENRITNSDWARISETLGFSYNADKLWLVEYSHGSKYEYYWRVFYMVEDEEEIERFLSCRYLKYRYQKINDHLYVCLDRRQML